MIEKLKSGFSVKSQKEFSEYIGLFLDENSKKDRLKMYVDKMNSESLPNLASAKHELLRQIFGDYIQQALIEANNAAIDNQPFEAKKIVVQLGKLRDVFKNHDVMNYKEFIKQSDINITDVEIELLFLEPILNKGELNKLTEAFISAFGKKNVATITKSDYQARFFTHPLIKCLDAYSDFKNIEKNIRNEVLELGKYKNLIKAIVDLRENINAEEYQGFITYVINEDLTKGLANILRNENYKPIKLRSLLKNMTEGKEINNEILRELIGEIKVGHTKNISMNTKRELIKNVSSNAALNDYGFDIDLLGNKKTILFHGHATENAGANQREQQSNTANTARGFGFDTIGLTVLRDEVTRTEHHKNFLRDFSHLMHMSCTEEVILSGLQFDASHIKTMALDTNLQKLKDGDFLNSNHYIIKADIERSQSLIINSLGKNDLELLCEKKNAYTSIVKKNKDFFKSVIETTSTNNELAFQLLSIPLVDFYHGVLDIEEEAGVTLLSDMDLELIQEIFSVSSFNPELATKSKRILKSIKNRNDGLYESIGESSLNSLAELGVLDKDVKNRDINTKSVLPKDHTKLFKNSNVSLVDCLSYLKKYPLGKDYTKGYKTRVINGLKEKIIESADKTLNYRIDKKEWLLDGIERVTDKLKDGETVRFVASDFNAKISYPSRKMLASLLRSDGKTENEIGNEIGLLNGMLALANLTGAKMICSNEELSKRVKP